MKRNISPAYAVRITVVITAALLAVPAAPVEAQEATTTPEIATTTPILIEGSVDVPAACEVTDLDGVLHAYPATASSTEYLAICALAAALDEGIVSEIGLSNQFPDFGLFVTKIDDVEADPASEFWALYHNDAFAAEGVTSLPVAEGDTIAFALQDFSGADQGDRLTLRIESLIAPETATSTLAIEGDVDVPAECTVVDTDGVTHAYPSASSTDAYLGICAVAAALESGVISTVGLSNQFPDFGLFVTSVNEVAADPASEFWALFKNGEFASSGLTSLPVAAGDALRLERQDFSGTNLGDYLDLRVKSLLATSSPATSTPPSDPPSSGGGGGGGTTNDDFDVDAAVAFLASEQEENGSFDSLFLSDWAAFALRAADADEEEDLLRAYLLSVGPEDFSTVTDYERHAIALLALGINPYAAGGEDFITPIVEVFDGEQIGDDDLDNDDIFALFPLLSTGYDTDDAIIENTVAFIVGRQQASGAWDGSVDVTAAAIQALTLVDSLPGVEMALLKAEAYLRGVQGADGGFGNSFSTSWVLQAIEALGDSPHDWEKNGESPLEYLADLQEEDGGVEPLSSSAQVRQWATIYAIPAALGVTWDSLLRSFPKPDAEEDDDAGTTGTVLGTASSTPAFATSTPPLATSTPALVPEPAPFTAQMPAQTAPATLLTVLPETETVPEETFASTAPELAAVAASGGVLERLWGAIVAFFAFLMSLI